MRFVKLTATLNKLNLFELTLYRLKLVLASLRKKETQIKHRCRYYLYLVSLTYLLVMSPDLPK